MDNEALLQLIKGCIEQDRKQQKMLYKAYYGYAMSICMRYTCDRDLAAEVMNQGFLKMFNNLEKYKQEIPFKAWLGKIMINVSIDFYRSTAKMRITDDLDQAINISSTDLPDKNLSYNELLNMISRLPISYRTVFNLFAIEGYSHEEIADLLNISEGTSKSNLFKARQKLKQMILISTQSNYRVSRSGDMDFAPISAIKVIDMNGVLFKGGIIR